MLLDNMNNFAVDYTTNYTNSLIEQCTPRIRNLAAKYDIEFDDFLQEVSITIWQIVASKPQGMQLASYVMRTIDNAAKDIAKGRYYSNNRANYEARYLSERLADDNDFTLADTIPAPSYQRLNNPRHIRALYRACKQLNVQHQTFLKNHLGLKFHVNNNAPKGIKCSSMSTTSINDRMYTIVKKLRSDAALARVVAR